MPAEVSKLKPDASTFKRPTPNIEWNDRTEKSYSDNGFSTEQFKASQEKTFLSQVDLRKAPIERTVTKIVRLKAVDYNTEKRERKEYLYYFENWTGVNWLGIPIAPVTDHIEGLYEEAEKEIVFDPRSGEPTKYKFKGTRPVHYIPFDRKEVDKIIKNSAHSNVETIKYVVKFAAEDWDGIQGSRIGTRFEVSYDQFVNWSFKDLYVENHKPLYGQEPKNVGPVTKGLYK
jgi:hypothetical protein